MRARGRPHRSRIDVIAVEVEDDPCSVWTFRYRKVVRPRFERDRQKPARPGAAGLGPESDVVRMTLSAVSRLLEPNRSGARRNRA